MLRLFVEAATQESALSMCNALADYDPEIELDDGRGQYFVSVKLGGDGRAMEVLAKLYQLLHARAAGPAVNATVGGDSHQYRRKLRAVETNE